MSNKITKKFNEKIVNKQCNINKDRKNTSIKMMKDDAKFI